MDAAEGRGTEILVVDDDPLIRSLVEACLRAAGYRPHLASCAIDALTMIQTVAPAVVVLDLGLPDMDGLTLTSQLKAVRPGLGIIILSGRTEPVERIVGLEIGADDYLCKPFEPRELVARIRSLLRRMAPAAVAAGLAAAAGTAGEGGCYAFAGYRLDTRRVRLLDADGGEVHLSSSEYALLKAFVERPQRVLSRDQLLDLARGQDMPAFDRSIDVQIARLRKKIEADPKEPSLIKTIRNQGYIFSEKVTPC